MRSIIRSGFAAGLVLAAVVAVPGQAAARVCVWEPTVLPLPPGATDGAVDAADGDGWFAGWTSNGPFGYRSTTLWHGDEMVPIGPVLGQTDITGVNPSGTMVGAVREAEGETTAVIYRDGAWHRLPKVGNTSRAYDVNAAGDTVGSDQDGEKGINNLTVWPYHDPDAPRVLPPVDGFGPHLADPRIDDDGTVIATYVQDSLKGYVWTPGASAPARLMPLETDGEVIARDIRNGRIVGTSSRPDGTETIGAEWNLAGQIVRTFPVQPLAVNSYGLVVGHSVDDNVLVVLGPDQTIEPVLIPDGFSWAWANGFTDTIIGGRAENGPHQVVPLRWQRSC